MFKKILIANRGEIALRIIWACKELGLKTVAVYSEADRDSLHVRFADEAVCIGPAKSKDSYLNIPRIIAAAEISGADAIHPGFGFLSEKPDFVEALEACKIAFIGPGVEAVRKMGDKAVARETMIRAGLPVLPGSDGPLPDVETAKRVAEKIKYPVIIKASAGGGGRGMRVCWNAEELEKNMLTAQTEAGAAFGSSEVYMEKYLVSPRHIEIQLMADHHGNVIHLGERECSVQRRHQKLLEEAPSAVVTPELRAKMGAAAVAGAKAVDYRNAGTMEFLLDEDGSYYFMEMNTRIQVEHPVTESVTGMDLIKAQIRVAAGEKMNLTQEHIRLAGHAIECRINAEDPVTFAPSPGLITTFHPPGGPGVRLDTHAYAGYFVSPHYDSMIAKLIVYAPTRLEAIARMHRALDSFVIEGIKTSIPLQKKILEDADFMAGKLSTKFMERFMPK